MKVSVFRKEQFNASHRLNNVNWSVEKNKEVFGKCNLPNYHGHNYELVLKVTGNIDAETGYLVDMKWLSDLLNKKIINKFNYKNLNLDVPEFKKLNPTAENIAKIIFEILRPSFSNQFDILIRLYETERNFVEYPTM